MTTAVTTRAPAVAVPRARPYRGWRWLADLLTYLGLAAALVFFLGPFFWIVTTSLKGNSDFFAYPPVWIPSKEPLKTAASAACAASSASPARPVSPSSCSTARRS